VVDVSLSPAGSTPLLWSSNIGNSISASAVALQAAGTITIDGSVTTAEVHTIAVGLGPMEVQILRLVPDPGQRQI
jgi:hypothetical protein